jgi:PAS domain S-box-containing protein
MPEETVRNILPNFTEKEINLLKHYFEFNKRYYDKTNKELATVIENHPVWGPLLGQITPEQQEANRKRSLELQRLAIFEGKWEDYTKDLIAQGITYARMNISYSEWYKLIKLARQQLFPHLLEDFPESRGVISYMEGMTRMIDFAMYGIAEAYFTEKNNIIRAKDELFRAIFENSVDHMMVINSNMTILMMNHANEGMDVEPLIGSNISAIAGPGNFEELENSIKTVIENKKPYVYESEYKVRGEIMYFSSSLSPILDEEGKVDKIVFISRDISEKKKSEIMIREMNARLEAKVNARTEELRKSNADLEQFAYVASHDLQEPLRTISNYVALLERSNKDNLDEKSLVYLNFIVSSARRMQLQIQDLLQYSRTGHNMTLKEINCNRLVDEVLHELDALIKDKKPKIEVGKLPVIKGYTELKSVFQNLISNAIKFSQKGEPADITISATEKPKEWMFAVKDKGIGIDKQYFDKIFIIFQKLHQHAEYPGSGIGLSQSKKIVEMHNGKIWLESEPGKGSTFYFTIPKMM